MPRAISTHPSPPRANCTTSLPRRVIRSSRASSPRSAGPGAIAVSAHGTQAGNRREDDEYDDSQHAAGRPDLSGRDLLGRGNEQRECREVGRHRHDTEAERLTRAHRAARCPGLALSRPSSLEDQRDARECAADDDVELRVEVRLGRQRDRPAEQDEDAEEDEQRQHRSGRVPACRSPTVGTGEDHGLLRQHHRAEGTGEAERNDEEQHLEHCAGS